MLRPCTHTSAPSEELDPRLLGGGAWQAAAAGWCVTMIRQVTAPSVPLNSTHHHCVLDYYQVSSVFLPAPCDSSWPEAPVKKQKWQWPSLISSKLLLNVTFWVLKSSQLIVLIDCRYKLLSGHLLTIRILPFFWPLCEWWMFQDLLAPEKLCFVSVLRMNLESEFKFMPEQEQTMHFQLCRHCTTLHYNRR